MTPESESALLDQLHSEFSDFYKELYNIRPRWVRFASVEDAEDAIVELAGESEMNREMDRYHGEVDSLALGTASQVRANQPGPYDREHLPKFAGMGRRSELDEKLRRRLRRIIREVVRR